jgi:hypothetical protein
LIGDERDREEKKTVGSSIVLNIYMYNYDIILMNEYAKPHSLEEGIALYHKTP